MSVFLSVPSTLTRSPEFYRQEGRNKRTRTRVLSRTGGLTDGSLCLSYLTFPTSVSHRKTHYVIPKMRID